MHSRGFGLTKLTNTRLEDNLILHLPGRPAHIFVVVVLTSTRIIKSVVTGQAPVTGAEEYPREEQKQTKGSTRIYHS